jgi:hypothetical protein
MNTPDVVVLVPGFLGFARFGGFYYFADRVASVMRGHLEEALGYPVPVVPCTTLPTDSLSKRQRILLDSLRVLCTAKLSGVERFHLVGHSTGGVDAQLLSCTSAIDGHPWSSADEGVRKAHGAKRMVVSLGTLSLMDARQPQAVGSAISATVIRKGRIWSGGLTFEAAASSYSLVIATVTKTLRSPWTIAVLLFAVLMAFGALLH